MQDFSKEDITEMIGKKYDNNIKTAALGLMFYELTINKEVNSKNYDAKHMNLAIDCFMESTGIALVGALAG
jgi:hypothetical protein